MKILYLLRCLLKDQKGVAALEFALCTLILSVLFCGVVDITRMVMLHLKVDKAMFTAGDVVTRVKFENACSMVKTVETDVAKEIIKPFDWDAQEFGFVMTAVIGARMGEDPKAPVQDLMEWQYATMASAVGTFSDSYKDVAILPVSIQGLATDERIIVTEMKYTFNPIMPDFLGLKKEEFKKISYLPVRHVGNIGKEKGPLNKLDCP